MRDFYASNIIVFFYPFIVLTNFSLNRDEDGEKTVTEFCYMVDHQRGADVLLTDRHIESVCALKITVSIHDVFKCGFYDIEHTHTA